MLSGAAAAGAVTEAAAGAADYDANRIYPGENLDDDPQLASGQPHGLEPVCDQMLWLKQHFKGYFYLGWVRWG